MANNKCNSALESWREDLLLREFQTVKPVKAVAARSTARRSPVVIYDPTSDTLELAPEKPIKPCVGAVSTANLMAHGISRGYMTRDLLRSLQVELRRHVSGKCDCAILCPLSREERRAA
jgi:hypothetical protein